MFKNISEVRESLAYYGEESGQTVDFITVLAGKTLPESTQLALSSLTLNEVANMSNDDLLALDGIGKVAAERILAAIGLGKSMKAERFKGKETITSSERAKQAFNHLRGLDQEHVAVAFLDTKNQIISKKTIFIGSLNSSVIHPREIFKQAVKVSAARIMVAHNHPSGHTDPSDADLNVTRRLSEAGELMGIELLDHIIVGDTDNLSLKEAGYM